MKDLLQRFRFSGLEESHSEHIHCPVLVNACAILGLSLAQNPEQANLFPQLLHSKSKGNLRYLL